jgi:hypothetical protein
MIDLQGVYDEADRLTRTLAEQIRAAVAAWAAEAFRRR